MQALTVKVDPTAAKAAFRTRRDKLIAIVAPAFETISVRAERKLKSYPPDRGYRRTGTLGRRWQRRTIKTARMIRVTLFNMTPYGRWVQSQESQAWMHRGIWQTDVDVLEEIKPDAVREVSGALIRGLR